MSQPVAGCRRDRLVPGPNQARDSVPGTRDCRPQLRLLASQLSKPPSSPSVKMRLSTVFSVLTCGAMTLAAAVAPDALVSRSSGISKVIGILDTTLDTILPKLGSSYSLGECARGMLSFAPKITARIPGAPRASSLRLLPPLTKLPILSISRVLSAGALLGKSLVLQL